MVDVKIHRTPVTPSDVMEVGHVMGFASQHQAITCTNLNYHKRLYVAPHEETYVQDVNHWFCLKITHYVNNHTS